MPEKILSCFHCGQSIPLNGKIMHRDTCPQCDWDLHSCENCRFFDPGVRNGCREPLAEPPQLKERANYCDYFDPRVGAAVGGRRVTSPDQPRKAWDDLFRKK